MKQLIKLFLISFCISSFADTNIKSLLSIEEECINEANAQGNISKQKTCELTSLGYEDNRLNDVYGLLLKNLNDSSIERLKIKQREWINYRDKRALEWEEIDPKTGKTLKTQFKSFAELQEIHGRIGSIVSYKTELDLTRKRANKLENLLSKTNVDIKNDHFVSTETIDEKNYIVKTYRTHELVDRTQKRLAYQNLTKDQMMSQYQSVTKDNFVEFKLNIDTGGKGSIDGVLVPQFLGDTLNSNHGKAVVTFTRAFDNKSHDLFLDKLVWFDKNPCQENSGSDDEYNFENCFLKNINNFVINNENLFSKNWKEFYQNKQNVFFNGNIFSFFDIDGDGNKELIYSNQNVSSEGPTIYAFNIINTTETFALDENNPLSVILNPSSIVEKNDRQIIEHLYDGCCMWDKRVWEKTGYGSYYIRSYIEYSLPEFSKKPKVKDEKKYTLSDTDFEELNSDIKKSNELPLEDKQDLTKNISGNKQNQNDDLEIASQHQNIDKTNSDVKNSVLNKKDIAWLHQGKVLHPQCFNKYWDSADNYQEFYEQFMGIKDDYFRTEEYDHFTKNIGIYWGKYITTYDPIKASWDDDLELSVSMDNCLNKKTKVFEVLDDRVTSQTEEPRDRNEYYYEKHKKIPLDVCQKLGPNISGKCVSSYLLKIGNWWGGSKGYDYEWSIFGIFELFDGEEYIFPLKRFSSDDEARSFIQSKNKTKKQKSYFSKYEDSLFIVPEREIKKLAKDLEVLEMTIMEYNFLEDREHMSGASIKCLPRSNENDISSYINMADDPIALKECQNSCESLPDGIERYLCVRDARFKYQGLINYIKKENQRRDFLKKCEEGHEDCEIINLKELGLKNKIKETEAKIKEIELRKKEEIEEQKLEKIRSNCIEESKKAKTEFTAKKIYETCLDKNGEEDK